MDLSKPKAIFILGGPGCGKGTACEQLVKEYKFQHISTGDLFRAEIKKESDLGKEIQEYVSHGKLVPGDVGIKMLRKGLEDRGWNKHVFIIDGFPRSMDNIHFWNNLIKDDVDVVGALYLNCSAEVMRTRILKRGETSGRSDDNEDTLKTRVQIFMDETLPIVDYFKKQGKLYEVSADGSIEQTFVEVKKIVENLNLDKMEEINEIKSYLSSDVDPYLKPLIAYLLKNKPKKVHHAIRYWLESEGEDIRKTLENE